MVEPGPSSSSFHCSLALFFSRGVSLRTWDEVGMFEREVALYRRLQNEGVRIAFVTYGGREDRLYAEKLPGMEIRCNRWGLPSRLYEWLLPILHGDILARADILKTNQTDGADVALRAARIWRKPLIARCGYMWSDFSERIYGAGSDNARKAKEVEAKVFTKANRVVVTTRAMREDILNRMPGVADRTYVIPNYVDTDRFRPFPGASDRKSLLFVGRLSPQKNLETLLEAVSGLDVGLTVIGEGELKDKLQRRYGTLEGKILWQGRVPHEELPVFMNRASLFVLPSAYEGHPKVLIEAMSCGTPALGTAVPGIRDVIHHGETGWLCEPRVDSLRNAIAELLADSNLRKILGEKGREFVLENFGLDRIVDREMNLYKYMLAPGA